MQFRRWGEVIVATAPCGPQNFHTMEPLRPREAAAEAAPPEEAVVASIRSATKELHESVKDLCECSLGKITALGQCPRPAGSGRGRNACWTPMDLLFTVNQESVTGPTAGGAAGTADAAVNTGPARRQSTGALLLGYLLKEKVDTDSNCSFFLFSL